MTPGARVAAAIAILDRIADGIAPEAALTGWARSSRYAGSKDRAAVRDHVFDVVRQWRSTAALGGAATGRGRMIGLARKQGWDVAQLFNGQGHAPAPLTDAEQSAGAAPQDLGRAWDLPDWLVPIWQASLGDEAQAAAEAAQERAPVTLRARGEVARVAQQLRDEGIDTAPNARAPSALRVLDGARRIRQSQVWSSGQIELQDAASQALTEDLSPNPGRALDYCAGGGGKALALVDAGWSVTAHDIDAARMSDLPARAARAGVKVQIAAPGTVQGTFDLVFCDAPCSGSGAWRRAPQGKWALTSDGFSQLQRTQDRVLDAAKAYVAPGGVLVYATCSVLTAENEDRVAAFVDRHPEWRTDHMQRWPLDALGDGFFSAHLRMSG